jgi:predicted enzyme related to lactoylglutathione lyase
MTQRSSAPVGSPCWADLWTSDVEGSRRFYGELFGWEADAPNPEFGGYFIFNHDGVEMAGAMGDMGEDMPANDTWKVYLATDDMATTLGAAEAQGAQVIGPAMAVGDLGIQAVLIDPTGAHLGAWEARGFPGFIVLDQPGAPSWFELHTRDHATAVRFDSEHHHATPGRRGGHGRDHGRLRLPPRGSRRPLVALLGSRRHRCRRVQSLVSRRLSHHGRPGHSLRSDRIGGRHDGCPVQAAHRSRLSTHGAALEGPVRDEVGSTRPVPARRRPRWDPRPRRWPSGDAGPSPRPQLAPQPATTREIVDPVSAAATPCTSTWLTGAPPDSLVAVTKTVVVTAMPQQPPTWRKTLTRPEGEPVKMGLIAGITMIEFVQPGQRERVLAMALDGLRNQPSGG